MGKKLVFYIGEHVAGLTILEIKPGLAHQDIRYRVKYDCCVAVGWITHKGLTLRIRINPVSCKNCAAMVRHNNKTARKGHVDQVFVSGWGMTLGEFYDRATGRR